VPLDPTPSRNPITAYPQNFPSGEISQVWGDWFSNIQTTVPTLDDLSASTGADLVGTILPVSTAETRPLSIKMAETVTVTDFGATGNGSTDDTQALKNAFTYAPAGATIRFPKGTYKVSGSASITRTVSGDIVFDPGAIIDATDSTASVIFLITGSIGTGVASTNTITAGDTSATINSSVAASLSKGDILFLSSNPTYGGDGSLWNTDAANYYKGEMIEVRSVAGSVVTFETAALGTYGVGVVGTVKMTPVTTNVRGFNLKANKTAAAQGGLRIQYGKNCTVRDGLITGCSHANHAMYYVLHGTYDSVAATDNYNAATGLCYGVLLASCQFVEVRGSYLIGGRHGISMGGNEPVRYVTVAGNFIDSDTASGQPSADTHANCDYITFIGNKIKNGMGMSAKTVSITGNQIQARGARAGVQMFIGEHTAARYLVNGNSITSTSTSQPPVYLLGSGTMDLLTIQGNQIRQESTTTACIFSNNTGKTAVVTTLNFSNNDVYVASGGTGHGVSFIGTGTGISFGAVDISNNRISAQDRAIYFNGALATATTINIMGNTLIGMVLNAQGVDCLNSGATTIRCNRNRFTNSASTNFKTMSLTATTYVEILGNLIENCTSGPFIATATDILVSDNKLINVTGSATLTGRYYNQIINDLGNVRTWGSAAPTTGTWKKGDIWENTNATVGQAKGALCSTAGTPGTWTSTGNL